MIPKPTEVIEQRIRMGQRAGTTIEEIRHSEQRLLWDKRNLRPISDVEL